MDKFSEKSGMNAGKIYCVLREKGKLNTNGLMDEASLSPSEFYCAIGWLQREGKIKATEEGRGKIYELCE